MEIIVAAIALALVLILVCAHTFPSADRVPRKPRLTVADIQARLAAESPRDHIPASHGW